MFGSVARGDADEGCDVDLRFVMRRPLSLMGLGRLEDEVSAAAGVPVDLRARSVLRQRMRAPTRGNAVGARAPSGMRLGPDGGLGAHEVRSHGRVTRTSGQEPARSDAGASLAAVTGVGAESR